MAVCSQSGIAVAWRNRALPPFPFFFSFTHAFYFRINRRALLEVLKSGW